MHEAFANAGKQTGIEIWRIEKFNPVPYPKREHGKFYTGDSYIILFTKKENNHFDWDIHFWLGSETTQDESGTAAILSVDLDDQLGGLPVQYREVQEHESQKFLNLFKNGVRYLPGGIESGFQHVQADKTKRLFKVKGIKNIRVKQVSLEIGAMNKGDCFILDSGTEILVYVGAKSKRMERLKATEAATQIRDQDHSGRPKITILDQFSDGKELQKFFTILGSGSPAEVPDEDAGGDDAEFENNENRIVTLYKVSDASGKMRLDKVATKPLAQNLLDTNDCFILDTEKANIFVWIGKKCTKDEKRSAMDHAQEFLKTKNYPKWTRVQRIVEGGEPTAFKQYFTSWKDKSGAHVKVGEAKLYHIKILDSGRLTKETLTEFGQEDLDEDDVMILDSGKQIFLWIGKDSSEDEKSESMKIAQKLLKQAEYGNNIQSAQQGKEPADFTSAFKNWKSSLWAERSPVEDRIKQLLE